MSNLHQANMAKFKCLEFRPWPKEYNLKNREEYSEDSTYYFGIRIKQGPENGDLRENFPQIDLTQCRNVFYKKLQNLIYDPMEGKNDHIYQEDLNDGNIDIDVRCLTRDELPDLVKPKIERKVIHAIDPQILTGPRVGDKRGFDQIVEIEEL